MPGRGGRAAAVDPATAQLAASNFAGSTDRIEPFLADQFGSIFWACDPAKPKNDYWLQNGSYLYTLRTDSQLFTRKMVLLSQAALLNNGYQ